MPRILSDTAIRAARATGKRYSLGDALGLFLEVSPQGGKWWRFRYTYNGKRKTMSLGTYPQVSLKEARIKRDNARQLLEDGKDPLLLSNMDAADSECTTFGYIAKTSGLKPEKRFGVRSTLW